MKTSDEILSLINEYLDNLPYERKPAGLYDPIKYVLSIGGKRIRPTLMLLIIDATCPVVLQLQKKIKKQYEAPSNSPIGENPDAQSNHSPKGGTRGAIVIFGKPGHAEVLGLVGQTGGNAIVIAHFDDVKKLDFTRDIYLYSQTTKSLDEFHRIIEYIQEHISPEAHFQSFDTICRQVANRMPISISTTGIFHWAFIRICPTPIGVGMAPQAWA